MPIQSTSYVVMDHHHLFLRPIHTMRQITATSRLVCTATATILLLRYVAQIQTSLNSCDRSQQKNSVAATMIFTCHTGRFVAATCCGDVSQQFVASCVSAFKPLVTTYQVFWIRNRSEVKT